MTRNTLTKARIILVDKKTKTFGTKSKITVKEATQGTDYIITYSYAHLFVKPDAHHPFLENDCEINTSQCRCTHYSSYEEARKIIIENKKMLKAKGEAYTASSSWMSGDTPVEVQASFETYYDTVTKTTVFRKEETKKWGKNLFFIDRRNCSHTAELSTKTQFFTITEEPESLLIEFFGIKYDENHVLRIIVSPYNLPFRIYKDGRAYEVVYKESKHAYVDRLEVQLYADDERFKNIYYYYNDSSNWGISRAIDATSGYCEEENWGNFTVSTREMLTKFGIPEFMFDGYCSTPTSVDSFLEMVRAFLKFSAPYNKNETLICQEISTFLNGVPFDEDHAVIKYKNGYILRLGKIIQCYKITNTRGYDHKAYTHYSGDPASENDGDSVSELVSEQYIEYARLFVNNTLSTRSLALSTDAGRRWRHEGIHLVGNLFQANPKTSHLEIDVEKRNRAALTELYTVHPKLKYMKKYMEKHPDVLYNSCVPFLRALFQYDMILETLIALDKDGIFWKEDRNRYHYYGYRSSRYEYEGTKEYFSMDEFVECFQLRDLPQRGDFYQRLGMTKQQFKLLFEDAKQAIKLFNVIKRVKFVIPALEGEGHEQTITLDSWNAKRYRPLLKYVSFEDFRLIVEVIKKRLTVSDSEYSIGNDINSLQTYYGSIKRVHKAICQKTYDLSTLTDYLRMRQQLKQDQFPDFHESIWDQFPDDQEELQRYHDRIMFLNEENDAVKTAYARYGFIINDSVSSANDLYKILDNGGITASSFNDIVKLASEVRQFADSTVDLRDLIPSIPTNLEELEALSTRVNEARIKFFNLYSMYWEENNYRMYHGSQQTISAKLRWGNLCYRDFIIRQLAKNLDLNKYDLYLTLRRKFAENDPNFQADSYPYEITAQEDLDHLYEELAAREPELNALIAERERQRREAVIREQENRIAEQQKKYVERYKKLKKFNYAGDDERCIVVPQNLVSLIIEGQTLHHCVGSFVDSVSNGDNTIVFLRKKEDRDAPYVTISLLQNGKEWYIDQAHGDQNSDISEEDVAFLKIWAKENNIRLDSVKTQYGMHGHN